MNMESHRAAFKWNRKLLCLKPSYLLVKVCITGSLESVYCLLGWGGGSLHPVPRDDEPAIIGWNLVLQPVHSTEKDHRYSHTFMSTDTDLSVHLRDNGNRSIFKLSLFLYFTIPAQKPVHYTTTCLLLVLKHVMAFLNMASIIL